MKSENPFIKRPVFAICISILMVIIGVICYFGLSIEKFPNIAPPTVLVSASYPGASAETMEKAVVMPLEEAINGVENMNYMTSSIGSGELTLEVFFKQGTDPDQAAVNVQNRVSVAQGLLPSEVTKIGVQTMKRQNSTLAIITFFSPNDKFDLNFLSNFVEIYIKPQIQRIPGVGGVNVLGFPYSLRIWLNPSKMASYNLEPSDIADVLAEQNIEVSMGSFGENSGSTFVYTLKYRGRFENEKEIGDLVIRADKDGNVLRIKDIATVELGAQAYNYKSKTNGHPGVVIMINQAAGSNATEINNQIAEFLKNASSTFPNGIEYEYLQNTNDFLFASIHEVVVTLIIAIILVIIVVFFFLQNWVLTLVPTISLIVSLIGTFIGLQLMGFSINLLTLFALILVIGTVVDDAICVVEAVQEKMESGEKSSERATAKAMHDITAAIATCTLVFVVVFIPVSFMGGTSGVFYKQFGLTMAFAVALSLLNAMTLSPALCAVMLRKGIHYDKFTSWVKKAYDVSYVALSKKYSNGIKRIFSKKWLIWVLLVASFVLAIFFMKNTKKGLVPEEDSGMLFVSLTTSVGTSLEKTNDIMNQVENILASYPEVETFSAISGYNIADGSSAQNAATLIVRLKDWKERTTLESSIYGVWMKFMEDVKPIKDAEIFAMMPPMIDGYGKGNAIEFYLQDRNGGRIQDLEKVNNAFATALMKRPEIAMYYTSFQINNPQYLLEVDAVKCKQAGLSPVAVLSVVSAYYSGIYASNINRFSKVYRVLLQADPRYRSDMVSIDNIYVRSGDTMAAVSNFVTLKKIYGPESLTRFNMFSSISVSISVADGYGSGDAIAAIDEVAKEVLPNGYSYEFGGMSREQSSGNNTVIVLIVCLVFIYLVLSSLYESFLVPFAVILTVPFGILGCYLFATAFMLEDNIYLQTGMIMIIGLLAKTAILITEYAQQRRRSGMSIEEAAFDAAKARLRPIMMTVFTMVAGMIPMMFASGAGAMGSRTLGTGVVGGMIVGTIALLFVVPTFYIVFERIQEKIKPVEFDKPIENENIENE